MMMLSVCQNELINKFILAFIQSTLYKPAATAEAMLSKRNILFTTYEFVFAPFANVLHYFMIYNRFYLV